MRSEWKRFHARDLLELSVLVRVAFLFPWVSEGRALVSTYVGRSKLRVAVVAAVSVSVLAVGAVATFGPRSASARAAVVAAAGVEDEGAGCVVPEPGGAVSNARLPDPFLRMNGTRITSTG
ncbi:hypothetical protein LDL48_41535, partial [Wangella sp. NEAU-J3]|nr:hypothetical protein [Jidongwangia harbinensis]